MARAEKLKQLSMPKKPAGEQAADMDLEMLLQEEGEEADEMAVPGQPGMENELGIEEQQPASMMLAEVSDDELLAELKNRGLMGETSPIGQAAEADIVDEEALEPEEEMPAPPMKKKAKK